MKININSLIKIVYVLILSSILTGCMGLNSKNVYYSQNEKKITLSKNDAIAYAYMKNGDKLSHITFQYQEPENGYEVIQIKQNGFYPDFKMLPDEESGKESPGCFTNMSAEDKNYKFCKSYYTERTISSTGVSILWNVATTVTTVGLNVATGTIGDIKYFNQDKFLAIVKENNLIEIRDRIIELKSLENTHNNELVKTYKEEHNKYNENVKNISFDYTYLDKSGLLLEKKLNHKILINIFYPNGNSLSYDSYYQNKKFGSIDELNSFFKDLNIKLNSEFKEVKNNYKNEYVKNHLSYYTFSIDSKHKFILNDNISYNGELNIPQNFKYEYGVKKVVPVQVIIESANVRSITPKNFVLKDNNLNIDFMNQNNRSIDVISENKTSSFLTIQSLTSYINENVYTFSNIINREIAPESKTLKANSSYPLFSDTMTNDLNLKNITKKDLINKTMKYGFAVKYHIGDSNIEKTIFKTQEYNYLEIFKSLME